MAPIPVQEAGPAGPAGPPPSKVYRTMALVLRVLTFILLLISIAVLATNTVTVYFYGSLNLVKLRFQDVYSYRYLFGTSIVGLLYSALQTVATLYNISTGNQLLRGDTSLLFDFYADKIVSYILATGAAAAFGASKDLKNQIEGATDRFFNKGNICAALVLIAFCFTAISSVFSSFALSRRVGK